MSADEGEGEWQWHFVPKHIPLPAYPTAEELTARLEAAAEHRKRHKQHWQALPSDQQHVQETESRDYIRDLIQSIVARVPELAEDTSKLSLLAFAPGASTGMTRRMFAPATRLLCDTLPLADVLGSVPPAQLASWDVDTPQRARVYQARVVAQRHNPSCGYYALHFALAYAYHITTRDPAQAARLAEQFCDRTQFWRHYDLMHRHLLTHPRSASAPGYPWAPKCIRGGVMEREYMTFLQQHLDDEGLLPPTVRLLCLPEAASILGHGSHAQATAVAKLVDDFRSGKATVVVVCLGIVNHWVTLACARHGERYECVLLDSLNNFIFGAPDEDIWKIVVEYVFDRRQRGKKENRAEEYLYYTQMREIRDVVKHLVSLLLGSQPVLPRWLGDGVDAVLSAFERTVMTFPASGPPPHPVDVTAAVPGGPCRTPHSPCAYHAAAAASAGLPLHPSTAPDGMVLANGTCVTPELVAFFLDNTYHPKLIEEYTIERHALGISLPPRQLARLRAWICGLSALAKTPEYIALQDHVAFLARFNTTIARLLRTFSRS